MSPISFALMAAMLTSMAAARCPHYMHDVSSREKRDLTPLGAQIFMFDPRSIDTALTAQVIDMPFWSATMMPLCTSKVATRWAASYTIGNSRRLKYVELFYQKDPKTCKKHREAEMFLRPRYVLGSVAPLAETCTPAWRANTTSSAEAAIQSDLARELFSYWFQAAVRGSPKPHVNSAACKKGVEKIDIVPGTLGACFKKSGATAEIGALSFGPKEQLATVWAAVRYTCTEATGAVKTASLRATMPYNTLCAWNPSVSPNLLKG